MMLFIEVCSDSFLSIFLLPSSQCVALARNWFMYNNQFALVFFINEYLSLCSQNLNCCMFSFLLTACYILYRFKFDDERVTKEDLKRALEEQYGGEEEVGLIVHLFCISLPFCSDCNISHFRLLFSPFIYSYHRQILDSTTRHSNLQNIRMRICSFMYVKMTRKKLFAMWMKRI